MTEDKRVAGPRNDETFVHTSAVVRPDFRAVTNGSLDRIVFDKVPGAVLSNWPETAQEAHQALRPGGRLEFTTGHETIANPRQRELLRQHLEMAGFQDVRMLIRADAETGLKVGILTARKG